MTNQDDSDDLTKSLPTENPEIELSELSGVMPTNFGRYEVIQILGQGGFGTVYLGRDSQLDRLVAIKVPNPETHRSQAALDAFLAEAKLVAVLRHSGIVNVFDYGTAGEVPYIVLEYIRGRTLADYLHQESPTFADTARMIHSIAVALNHAHVAGFIHRDLKPQNVLLDNEDLPHISDFGLALRYREEVANKRGAAGTPAYMAPEQAMGENHRIDERTDIWALGVMLYQMLCGKKPFGGGSDFAAIMNKILEGRVVEPSKILSTVPPELERICMRCLSRRMANRYRTARELADDLEIWLRTGASESAVPDGRTPILQPVSEPVPVQVIPRGLRAFESEDAEFFVDLLPGPHDRHGVPLSLRFWKDAIEPRDTDNAFRVGLLYGPSGCGKSSLVRAGIVPLLSSETHVIHLDATNSPLEQRLLRQLRGLLPAAVENQDLATCMFQLREGHHPKRVLIVIEQFEQWLSQNAIELNSPLVQALRQCDGEHLQCLLLVRDDFWLQVVRFMNQLEIDIVDQQNAMLVDSFDKEHALHVLHKLGNGYERLPDNPDELSRLQREFLNRSINELAEQGRLYPVRLVIFAEMMRDQLWVPGTLDAMGGMTGIGVAFLEKTIGSKASTARRTHTRAAQRVMAALLPPQGLLKSGAVEARELLGVSGLAESPHDFEQLMKLLHTELRLLTPIAREEGSVSSESSDSQVRQFEQAYQLTHDYLVPLIREWIQLELKDTRQGRLSLALQDQANQWNGRKSTRYLPTFIEFLQYRFGTNRRDWTEPEAKMMSVAGKRFGRAVSSWTVGTILIMLVAFLAYRVADRYQLQQHVARLVGTIEYTSFANLPALFQELNQHLDLSRAPIEGIEEQDTTPEHKFRAKIFLVKHDANQVESLTNELIDSQFSGSYFPLALDALEGYPQPVIEILNARLKTVDRSDQLLRLACVWCRFRPHASPLADFNADIVDALLNQPASDAQSWIDALIPLAADLSPALVRKVAECPHLEGARIGVMALSAFQDGKSIATFAQLIEEGNEFAFRASLESLKLKPVDSVSILRTKLDELAEKSEGLTNTDVSRIASVTLAMWLLGEDEAVRVSLNKLRNTSLREHLITQISGVRCERDQIQKMVEKERDRDPKMASILLQGLVAIVDKPLPKNRQQEWIDYLKGIYRQHPNSELHSSAGRLLKQLKVDLEQLDNEIVAQGKMDDREWFIDPIGQMFVVIEGTHTYAIGTTEISQGVFDRTAVDIDPARADDLAEPVTGLLHIEIARFCNRLSEKAGIPPSQWCYPDDDALQRKCLPYPDYLQRYGYRLPTDDEWRYALRAGSKNLWLSGANAETLDKFCWDRYNTLLKLQPCAGKLTNSLGIFDMYGNAAELCYVNERVQSQDDVHALIENGSDLLNAAERMVNLPAKEVDRSIRGTYRGFRLARTLNAKK